MRREPHRDLDPIRQNENEKKKKKKSPRTQDETKRNPGSCLHPPSSALGRPGRRLTKEAPGLSMEYLSEDVGGRSVGCGRAPADPSTVHDPLPACASCGQGAPRRRFPVEAHTSIRYPPGGLVEARVDFGRSGCDEQRVCDLPVDGAGCRHDAKGQGDAPGRGCRKAVQVTALGLGCWRAVHPTQRSRVLGTFREARVAPLALNGLA